MEVFFFTQFFHRRPEVTRGRRSGKGAKKLGFKRTKKSES